MCVCLSAGYSVTQALSLLSKDDETIVTGERLLPFLFCLNVWLPYWFLSRCLAQQELLKTVKKTLAAPCCWPPSAPKHWWLSRLCAGNRRAHTSATPWQPPTSTMTGNAGFTGYFLCLLFVFQQSNISASIQDWHRECGVTLLYQCFPLYVFISYRPEKLSFYKDKGGNRREESAERMEKH